MDTAAQYHTTAWRWGSRLLRNLVNFYRSVFFLCFCGISIDSQACNAQLPPPGAWAYMLETRVTRTEYPAPSYCLVYYVWWNFITNIPFTEERFAVGVFDVPKDFDSPASPNQDGEHTCKPIIPATGEKYYTQSDYTDDTTAHPLNLERTYRSRWSVSGAPGFAAPVGLGISWAHNHSTSLQLGLAATPKLARILFGNGSTTSFSYNSTNNQWESSNSASTLVATTTPVGYMLTRTDDDSRWQFDNAGKLQTVTERNGWVRTYTYSDASTPTTIAPAAGYLIRVTNAFGRSLNLTYTSTGQLNTVLTPDGQTLRYAFDSTGRLTTVTYPGSVSGTVTKTYHYEDPRWPHSVTGITDERGTRLATVVYDASGRAVQSGYALGADQYTVSYPANSGDPTTVTDPLGTARTYSYGTAQNKLAVVGSNKPSGTGAADAASRIQNTLGLIDSETDFLGTTTTTLWDTTRRLPTSTTEAAGTSVARTTTTTWHPTWHLPTQTTAPGLTTDYTYDTRGNLLSQTDTDTTGTTSNGQKRTWSWTYTSTNLIATQTDPLGKVTTHTYNTAGQRLTSTNPLNQTTTYTYNTAGRLATITEPNGLVTSYTYDNRGRPTQISLSATGLTTETTQLSYTPDGQVQRITQPDGYQVTYTYDAAGRLTSASDNRGNTQTSVLDGMGNPTSQTLKDSTGAIVWTTSRTINSLNRIASIQDSQGRATTYGYDANGQRTSQTDPLGQTTSQTLDPLRRPTTTTLPDGNTTQTAWTALNTLASATDPKNLTTTTTRNAWGETLIETNPDSGTTTTTRDAAGNPTQTTDTLGNTATYTRDALGRITQIKRSGPGSNLLGANGTLNTSTAPAPTLTQTLSYDNAGNLASTSDTSTPANSSTATPLTSTLYTRDPLGRILQKTQTVADNPANPTTLTTRYTYHPGGTLASITYPSGLKVSYNMGTGANIGLITSINIQRPPIAGIAQPSVPYITNIGNTAWGQAKSWLWNCIGANGATTTTITTAACDKASRAFDQDARLKASEFSTLYYDATGRIVNIRQDLLAQGSTTTTTTTTTPIIWTATYDKRNRLSSFSRPGASRTYTYDPNSNRLSSATQTNSDTDLSGDFDQADALTTANYTLTLTQANTIAANTNRLSASTQTKKTTRTTTNTATPTTTTSQTTAAMAYTLDAQGNLSSDGLRQFGYDAANRLAQVRIGQTNPAEASKITYWHNVLGQRVFKSEPQVAQLAPNTSTFDTSFINWLKTNFGWLFAQAQTDPTLGTSYLYADGPLNETNLLGEYGNGSANSAGRSEYIWLPSQNGQAMPVALYQNDRFYAIHADHTQTPRRVTDDSGKVVWQWSYSAFGDNPPSGILQSTAKTVTSGATTSTINVLKATKPQVTLNLRMPGQYLDEESGLFYNYSRNYDPKGGRYTQGDPIGLSGGWNRFGYVNQNPLSFVDPEGLTQADVNAAVNAAKAMRPDWNFPADVKTWSQDGKGGKSSFGDKNIYIDSKYLECLDDGEAGALLSTLLHELTHFNQTWYQFGIDNIRERVTRGNSSSAQDTADSLIWKNYKIVAEYLKNRHVDKNSCRCRK